jgi:demethylmenaquinone methyltransferase/2-methoxy-6-polyprenyl-1,4-benzoquinol methylase
VRDEDDRARIRDQIDFYRSQARHDRVDRTDPLVDELVRAYFDDPELQEIVQTHCPSSDHCLELGSGPGRWTGALLHVCQRVTAIDVCAELHEVSRARHGDERVEYVVADLFEYRPHRQYDLIFAGYWLSHVPASRFDSFWLMVRDALAPAGQVVMVDDGLRDSDGIEHFADDPTGGGGDRRLPDGREFRIVKMAYAPRDLEARMAAIGWRAAVTVRPAATYVLTAHPN